MTKQKRRSVVESKKKRMMALSNKIETKLEL